jgi:hypothetical protein
MRVDPLDRKEQQPSSENPMSVALAGLVAAAGFAVASRYRQRPGTAGQPGGCQHWVREARSLLPQPEQTKTGSPGPTAAQLTECIEAHGVTVARSMPLKAWLQSAVSDPNDSNALTACGLDSGSPISK